MCVCVCFLMHQHKSCNSARDQPLGLCLSLFAWTAAELLMVLGDQALLPVHGMLGPVLVKRALAYMVLMLLQQNDLLSPGLVQLCHCCPLVCTFSLSSFVCCGLPCV